MRITDKSKIKELMKLKSCNVLLTDNDNKELKLGQLENIEEELGIDLVTLFKALENGVRFAYSLDEEIKPVQLRMFHEEPMLVHRADDTVEEEVYVKQHGITWKELL